MSTLPLEVHEVLEEEYVSMYGPLPLPESGAQYTNDQLPEESWARKILAECGIPAADVLQSLNALVTARGKTDLAKLAESPCISDAGRAILKDYDDYTSKASDADRQTIHRRVIDDALKGAVRPLRDVRLDNLYGQVHGRARDHGKPRSAFCISGGGIRSATFALGVMQGLAGSRILDRFDFLSTVSGGGYIGSWLSSWVRRNGRAASGVQDELRRADTAMVHRAVDSKRPSSKVDPEPEPLRHLRAYSNYLSPKLGIFSGDSWTLVAHYVRNLLLNLLVLVPLLAFALAAPRALSWLLEYTGAHDTRVSTIAWAYVAAGLTCVGFAYLGQKRPVQQGERTQKKAKIGIMTDWSYLYGCILWLALSAVALAVFWARVQNDMYLIGTWTLFWPSLIAVLGMTLLPYALYYHRYWNSMPAERRASFSAGKKFRREHIMKQLAELFAVVVAVVATALLLILLAKKVFDAPTLQVPLTATLSPIERAGKVTAPQAQLYVCFIVPMLLLVYFVQASIFVGLSSRHNEDYDREWWGRAGAWLVAVSVLLAAFSAISVFGPVAFYYAPVILASVGGVAGLVAALVGYSAKTPATDTQKEEGGKTAKAGSLVSALAVPLFVVALLSVISLGSTWLIQQFQDETDQRFLHPDHYAEKAMLTARYQSGIPGAGQTLETAAIPLVSIPAIKTIAHLQTIQHTSPLQLAIFLGVAAFGFLLSFFIGVNKFSMQALYRNRIIRAYLGASRYSRDPDHFTGFDENDNLQMWELQPELLWTTSISNVPGFVEALKTGEKPLGGWLWRTFDQQTKDALEREINAVSIDALVQNVNEILLTEDLTSIKDVTPPAWIETPKGALGYSKLLRNRATLDSYFADYIAVMAPPADADGAPKRLDESGRPTGHAPMHVVNMALNLTSGQNLAWQQRMAESFTATPRHAGSLYLGYRCSREYGGGHGISLGTAVAISGAAASPNMGYNSSPLMAFLLTFFNVRLGAWLGNPGVMGKTSYPKAHPTTGLIPMFEELTGNSTDTKKWVYLSDGGHFENLALYEMVLRRCHKIVLSDGGCDPTCSFDDLGNAVRKIRTDLGVPIDIVGKIDMFPRSSNGQPVKGQYVAFGKIRYSAIDKNGVDGDLIYLKPGVYESDYFPRDVYNYAQQSPQFPHEPTSDQFFSESQFESYRALGRHAINEICGHYANEPKELSAVAEFEMLVRGHAAAISRLKPEEVIANSVDRVAMAIANSSTSAAATAIRATERIAIAVEKGPPPPPPSPKDPANMVPNR